MTYMHSISQNDSYSSEAENKTAQHLRLIPPRYGQHQGESPSHDGWDGYGDAKKESIIIGQVWSKGLEMGQMTLLRKPTLL